MAVQIQILSDLHLEAPKAYDIFTIIPNAPYLALLGDIGTIGSDSHQAEYLAFLTVQLKQFRAVLLVPGNHEAYHSSWPATLDVLRRFEQDVRKDRDKDKDTDKDRDRDKRKHKDKDKDTDTDKDTEPSLGEFVLLDRAVFRLPGTDTVILGCSLFSAVPAEHELAVSMGLNDFFNTKDWDVGMHNRAHRRDLAWLNAQVDALEQQCANNNDNDNDVKIIIFSHWSPSLDIRAVEPRHAASPITSAFSTELRGEACFQSDRVKVWAFGHTHFNCDFTVERAGDAGPLRLLANQRGYYFAQAEGFDAEKTVEI